MYTIIWPYLGILVAEMIITKSLPPHWAFWFYLPAAVLWSILFYCIKGTVDPEDNEDEQEEERPSDTAAGLFKAMTLNNENTGLGDKAKAEMDGLMRASEKGDDKKEKDERYLLPGGWYTLISFMGMI